MRSETVSYAQNREDLILAGFFDAQEDGFYVDVGANDAVADSVTKLFYDRGWHGINIEPLRQHYEQLKRLRPRDINLRVGVGQKKGKLVLREYTLGSGLSTFSKSQQNSYLEGQDQAASHYVDHQVEIKTLASIFDENHVSSIQFMKVDVEGFEYEVLEGNDWQRFRPEVICIEANHIKKDWHPLLAKAGYVLAFFDGLNEYHVDKNKAERIKKFSYVDAILSREPIIGYRLLPMLEEKEHAAKRAIELEKELQIKNHYIAHLEGILEDITPLRRHAKRQLKHKLSGIDRRIIAKLDATASYQSMSPAESANPLAEARRVDQANFIAYNQSRQRTPVLSLYLRGRKTSIELANRLLRMRKV